MTTKAETIRTAGKKAMEVASDVLRQLDGANYSVTTVERSRARRVCSVTITMQRVVRTRQILFGTKLAKHSRYEQDLAATPLGHSLISAVTTDFSGIRRLFPKHILHPLFELVEAYVAEIGLTESLVARRPCSGDVEWLNRCVATLRARAKTQDVVRARDEVTKMAKRRIKALHAYIDAILRENEQHCVVRLNLGYAHKALSAASAEPPDVDAGMVIRHRHEFLRLARTLPSLKLVGFAYKLNHSGLNSYSIDILLFYLADTMCVGPGTAQNLGDIWTQVTGGRGSFYNYNALVDSRIGHLHRDNHAAVEHLTNTVAAEIVCGDYYARLDAPDRHVFEKGNLPKTIKAQRGRGRPRKASVNDLANQAPRGLAHASTSAQPARPSYLGRQTPL